MNLWPYQQDPTVQGDDPTVVSTISMNDRHPNVKQKSVTFVIFEYADKHLPAMEIQILFKKMVQAA